MLGSAAITTHYLNHTLMAMAYKITAGGRSVVYATDTEPFSQQPRAWESSNTRKFMHKGDAALADFVSGCDVLILDTQYTAHEYPSKLGWGHSTVDYAIDIAISGGVNTLVMFHHEPTRIDTAMTVLEQLAQRRVREEMPELEVYAAAEGLSLEMEDAPGHELPAAERRLPEFHPRVRIAVVGSSEDFMSVAWKALAQDHYDVVALNGLSSPRTQDLADFQPHLVVLEHGPEGWDSEAQKLISLENRSHVPVISVIPAGRFEYAQEAFDQGAADVIIEPFVATQLRSRVDSWLMRSGVAVDRRIRGRPAANQSVPKPS